MGHLHVELVAADRHVWQGEASVVNVRAADGDLGIMPGHAPILAVLRPGEISIVEASGTRQTAEVDGGFVAVDSDRVTIVVEAVKTAGQG